MRTNSKRWRAFRKLVTALRVRGYSFHEIAHILEDQDLINWRI